MPTQQRRQLSNPAIIGAIIAAVATVLAAAVPAVVSLVRDDGTNGSTPSAQESLPTREPGSVSPTVPANASSSPTSGTTGESEAPATDSEVRSLAEMPEVDEFDGWDQEPQIVAGTRHDIVLTASPCWLNDDFTATFVVSRKFRTLEAEVGIADDSQVAHPLKFSVLIDGDTAFSSSVGIGKVRPVKVDISKATQVGIRVSTRSTNQCHGDTIGVWIDPKVRR